MERTLQMLVKGWYKVEELVGAWRVQMNEGVFILRSGVDQKEKVVHVAFSPRKAFQYKLRDCMNREAFFGSYRSFFYQDLGACKRRRKRCSKQVPNADKIDTSHLGVLIIRRSWCGNIA